VILVRASVPLPLWIYAPTLGVGTGASSIAHGTRRNVRPLKTMRSQSRRGSDGPG
jgi:hypothetical protein